MISKEHDNLISTGDKRFFYVCEIRQSYGLVKGKIKLPKHCRAHNRPTASSAKKDIWWIPAHPRGSTGYNGTSVAALDHPYPGIPAPRPLPDIPGPIPRAQSANTRRLLAPVRRISHMWWCGCSAKACDSDAESDSRTAGEPVPWITKKPGMQGGLGQVGRDGGSLFLYLFFLLCDDGRRWLTFQTGRAAVSRWLVLPNSPMPGLRGGAPGCNIEHQRAIKCGEPDKISMLVASILQHWCLGISLGTSVWPNLFMPPTEPPNNAETRSERRANRFILQLLGCLGLPNQPICRGYYTVERLQVLAHVVQPCDRDAAPESVASRTIVCSVAV